MLRKPLMPWMVCFSAALFFFYEIMQLNIFNVIGADLMREYALSSTQLGWVSSAYFYANLLFVLPAGVMMDKFSTRRFLLCISIIILFATIIFAVSHSLALTIICRAIVGLGNGVAFLSCMRLASRWFPVEKLALVMGLIVTVAMLGGMVSQAPMSYLAAHLGWRGALHVLALLGAIITVLIFTFVRDEPRDGCKAQVATTTGIPLGEGLIRAMSSARNWFASVYTGLMSFPVMLLGALWGNLYLHQARGFSVENAASISGMLFLGLIVGSPLVGLLSDKWGQRKAPMVLLGVLSLFSIFSVMYLPNHSVMLAMLLFFVLGFLSAGQVLTYPFLAETNPAEINSMVMSIPAIALNLSVAIAQPLFGWLMHLHWHGQMLNGAPLFSLANYHTGFLLLVLAMVVSIVLALSVREKKAAAAVRNPMASELGLVDRERAQ